MSYIYIYIQCHTYNVITPSVYITYLQSSCLLVFYNQNRKVAIQHMTTSENWLIDYCDYWLIASDWLIWFCESKTCYNGSFGLNQSNLARSQFDPGSLWESVHTRLDRSQFALRKCSHSFRSISVRFEKVFTLV